MVIQRPGQVASDRLLNRRLVHEGLRIDKATLFPMFDDNGRIDDVLVVDSHSAELYVFSVATTRVRVARWGPMIVYGALEALTRHSIERIEDLWHFDPWWLLADRRFDSLEVTPLLKATNCVEKFRWRAKRVSYRSDLTGVVSVQLPAAVTAFRPSMVPREFRRQPAGGAAC